MPYGQGNLAPRDSSEGRTELFAWARPAKTSGGKKGQIRPMIRFCVSFQAARVTTGRVDFNRSTDIF
jgi:hypothetical protein